MIVVGVILLLLAYLLPDVIPRPPRHRDILFVLGWLGIVVGLILLLFGLQWSHRGRPSLLVLTLFWDSLA